MDDNQQKPSYHDDPDVQLMLDFQNGNPKAFEEILTLHYKRVLNFIYRYVNSREVAEDLTQEVFVKVYHSAKAYSPQSKLVTWIFTIAKNISFNELRRGHYKNIPLDATLLSQDGEMARQVEDTKAVNPHKELADEERAEIIRAAINELPVNQKTAVLLRRYEDLSYEDIARTMGATVQSVKSLLNRAKETLREKLAHLID